MSKTRVLVGVAAVAALAVAGVIIAKKMKGFGAVEAMPPPIDVTGIAAERFGGMIIEMAPLMAVVEECDLGQRVEISLITGQAATLQLGENEVGLREVVIGTHEDMFREIFVWDSEELTGGIRGLEEGWSARGLPGGGFWMAVWDHDEKEERVTFTALVGSDQAIWDGYVAVQQRRLRGEALRQALREYLESL